MILLEKYFVPLMPFTLYYRLCIEMYICISVVSCWNSIMLKAAIWSQEDLGSNSIVLIAHCNLGKNISPLSV